MSAPNFYVDDVVRVHTQPDNQTAPLVGLVGRVESVVGSMVSFEALDRAGEVKGIGWVPVDCLMHEFDPAWREVVRKRRASLDLFRDIGFADHAEVVS